MRFAKSKEIASDSVGVKYFALFLIKWPIDTEISLNPEQVITFLRCRWTLVPSGAVGLFVSNSSDKNRWLPNNEPIEKQGIETPSQLSGNKESYFSSQNLGPIKNSSLKLSSALGLVLDQVLALVRGLVLILVLSQVLSLVLGPVLSLVLGPVLGLLLGPVLGQVLGLVLSVVLGIIFNIRTF